ncbi:TPA: hypothetical protein L4J47_003876 [Enterobacter kobei]|nr:hypothetical protein [Enterobacter kobei]HBO1177434.1 hypothetical protein [Enterobacter kobei]HBO1181207.1 hypothetical protein [Enterobacter kobei]HBO2008916.1 hypothetical protein [Enterobacter kobei]HBO2417690.1 hypothetical protein [Enterobacter kobei]
MSAREGFVDYSESFYNEKKEKVKGLHISLSHGEGVLISHRVESDKGSKIGPFYLPDDPKELRKITKAINKIAKSMEG